MNHLQETALKAHSLVILRELLNDPAIYKLIHLLEMDRSDITLNVSAYCDFCAALFPQTMNFSRYLLNAVLESENVYIIKRAQKSDIPSELEACLQNELQILHTLSQINAAQVKKEIGYDSFLAQWQTEDLDFTAIYNERMQKVHTCGYGMFAKYSIFILDEGGSLVPVKYPDPQRLSDLSGYEYQRNLIMQNTLALLEGRPAANTLLYGDAGTGKSSTVKAIVNEYRKDGLRLIELKKEQLHFIPSIMDYLNANPLKFILFIDDLSFTSNDDNFAALKATLEGSVASKADNLAVYATSNRRHLIKETLSGRNGDDIHINDTLQELLSLSDRFGLFINFARPDKQLYLDIVLALADRYEIAMPKETLFQLAEAHAISRSGRSPRVAIQFVESLAAKKDE